MKLLAAVTTLALAVISTSANADGLAFHEGETSLRKAAYFPVQRAVIKWDGHEETLLVETTLAGPSGQYGWVVPLPHEPTFVKAVRPEYIEGTFSQVTPRIRSLPHEPLVYLGLGCLVACTLLLTSAYRYRRNSIGERVSLFFAEILGMLVAAPIALFFLSGGPGAAAADPGVLAAKKAADIPGLNVRSLGTIGAYNVSILSGTNGAAAYRWLARHHIQLAERAKRVFDQYATEGWVFLAAELRKDGEGPLPPHPLKAVFPCESPVYPMRLTGTQEQPIDLSLVVIGDRQASIDDMEEWSCRNDPIHVSLPHLEAANKEIFSDWQGDLFAMAKQGAVVTYLSATLTPGQMQRDFRINWSPYRRYEPKVYDRSEARGYEAGMYLRGMVCFAFAFGFLALFFPAASRKLALVGAIGSLLGSGVVPFLWSRDIKTVETVESGSMMDKGMIQPPLSGGEG